MQTDRQLLTANTISSARWAKNDYNTRLCTGYTDINKLNIYCGREIAKKMPHE